MNNKVSVFFDTNSYRKLVLNKNADELTELLRLIKSSEQKKFVEPISTLTVNLELTANLVEGAEGANYQNCLRGIQFLTQHCYDSNLNRIRIAALPFIQISAMIFGALPIDFEKDSKNISRKFENFMFFYEVPNMSESFYRWIKSTLKRQEREFANSLTGWVKAAKFGSEQIYPNMDVKSRKRKIIEYFRSDEYAQKLSVNSVKIVGEKLGIELDEEEYQKRGYFLKSTLPVASSFFQWVIGEVIERNIDLDSKKSRSKRWNWIWDYQIAFLISESTISDGETLLVTSDKEIIEILSRSGLDTKVMKIEEYLDFFKIT